MCALLLGSEFHRCIVSTIRRRRKRQGEHERDTERTKRKSGDITNAKTSKENHHQLIISSLSTDNDDTVCDCLLKLDISPSRHVLGKRKRMNARKEEKDNGEMTDKKRWANERMTERGLRKKVRDYGRSLLSYRGREGQRERETEKTKKGIIPASTWTIVCAEEGGTSQGRDKRIRIPGNNVPHIYFQI
jgi:hypothetical protein